MTQHPLLVIYLIGFVITFMLLISFRKHNIIDSINSWIILSISAGSWISLVGVLLYFLFDNDG